MVGRGWVERSGHVSPQWRRDGDYVWVNAGMTWKVDDKGDLKGYGVACYTVRRFSEKEGKVARSVGRKKFKTKEAAVKFALKQLRRSKK